MYRSAMEELKHWKDNPNRKPLILMGARQVGKTWLLKEFGRQCFDDVCYVNFENPGEFSDLFEGSIEPTRIIEFLGAYTGKTILPQSTLVIFDEVQEVPRALTSLKYFAENAPEYAVCCAGSFLGVTLHEGTSFPVGKIDFLTLQPMSFYEFLQACGYETMLEWTIDHIGESMPAVFRERYNDELRKYFIVGGMPNAVATWIASRDFSQVTEIQKQILLAYENDFSKHAPARIVPRLRYVWNSIPSQLAKENKKFIYGVVRPGARAREYEDALLWLRDSGVVRRLGRVKTGKLPLKAYEDLSAFKIYLTDVGLLRTHCEIEPAVIIDNQQVFREFNGSLTEQFVLQELSCLDMGSTPYYWSSENRAELDFLFSYRGLWFQLKQRQALL